MRFYGVLYFALSCFEKEKMMVFAGFMCEMPFLVSF